MLPFLSMVELMDTWYICKFMVLYSSLILDVGPQVCIKFQCVNSSVLTQGQACHAETDCNGNGVCIITPVSSDAMYEGFLKLI